MTISSEERELRRKTLGSSDIATILGFAYPYATAADVQFSKLYGSDEIENAGAVRVGNVVERALCEYVATEEKLAEPVVYSPPMIVHDLCPFHASLDALAPGRAVIEAKSTGKVDSWGTPGTDEVPDGVIVQVTWQMMLAGLDVAHIGALFTGLKRDVQRFKVALDPELARNLASMGEEWWELHIVQRRPIEAAPPALDTLRRIRREPKSFAVIDSRLVLDYKAAQAAAKKASDAKDEAQARLLASLGDAEAGHDEDGKVLVTYMESERKGYTVAPATYRRMVIPKERDE